jgi:hypothetical protein
MSNRGRKLAPWNGENLCIGVEPVVSAFDLGSAVALTNNPLASDGIRAAVPLDTAVPTLLSYRLAAS